MRSGYVKSFVTMYMHTLDGKPAIFCRGFRKGEEYVAFAGGTTPVQLVPTLRQIRREQRISYRNAAKDDGFHATYANPKRYGYVRVDVPLNPAEAVR